MSKKVTWAEVFLWYDVMKGFEGENRNKDFTMIHMILILICETL